MVMMANCKLKRLNISVVGFIIKCRARASTKMKSEVMKGLSRPDIKRALVSYFIAMGKSLEVYSL